MRDPERDRVMRAVVERAVAQRVAAAQGPGPSRSSLVAAVCGATIFPGVIVATLMIIFL